MQPTLNTTGVDAENLRAHFGFVSSQMQAFEDRHLQVFLFCVTGSAAIVSIPQSDAPTAAPWLAIVALNLVGLFLMRRLRIWIANHWQALNAIYQQWKLPQQVNVFERSALTKLPIGTGNAMQLATLIMMATALIMAFKTMGAPS